MRVAITGSSGPIGTALRARLEAEGHGVVPLIRGAAADAASGWDPTAGWIRPGVFDGVDVVVHLAGASIGKGRWNPTRRKELLESRVADEGVLIFPEGALFNPARLERAVARLHDSGAEEAERAGALRAVLPPRSGAFLSALAAAPDADVVFSEHRGLDLAHGYRALTSGELVGSEVVIRIRRMPRSQIPADSAGPTTWLWAQWMAIDRWVRTDKAGLPEAA